MKIFLIRHADAVDLYDDVILSDEYRYITPGGRKTTVKTAKLLKEHFSDLEIIYTSPLIRAVQTAEILALTVKFKGELIPVKELRNESSTAAFQSLLKSCCSLNSAAFVGHEPKMTNLAKLLTGKRSLNFDFGKTGVCMIEYSEESGTGRFGWYYNPKNTEFVF